MSSFFPIVARRVQWSIWALTLLCTATAFTFFLASVKIAFDSFAVPGQPVKPAAALTLIWFAVILQLVGGRMLVFRLFPRTAAFLLSGSLAVGYFLAHAPEAYWAKVNGGELAALYSFLFLYVFSVTRGEFGLDRFLVSA